MKILHIAHVDPSVLGGVTVAVPQMIRAQSAAAQVGLINLCNAGIDGVATALPQALLEETAAPVFRQPDLAVFHEVYRPAFLKLARKLKKNHIPYIIVPHGGLSAQAQKKKALKKWAANLLLFGPFIRRAEAVQYLSQGEAGASVFRVPHFVAGNGITIPGQRGTGSEGEGASILYIGRLEIRIKGLDLLLEAVAQNREALRQAKCHIRICGPDSEGAHDYVFRRLRELEIGDLVFLQGAVVGEEKAALLRSADFFIQSSRTEGMPMGVLEALGYGVPCILTQGTGMAGIVEEARAGIGCETTAQGIGQGLLRALELLPNRQQLADNASELARRCYDSRVIAGQTLEIYKRYVHGHL